MSTALPLDRVGAHGEPVPGCGGKDGTDVFRTWAQGFGFTFLGHCSIRQLSSGNWSVHAVKRAVDLGYPQNERARAQLYLAYLTENNGARARILGVQALHDYAIGEDGSYGTNHPRKRMWGHGQAVWRFGSLGAGWFWTHTELLVAPASSAQEMRRRLDLLIAYDHPSFTPETPQEVAVTTRYHVSTPARVHDTRPNRPSIGGTVVVDTKLPVGARAAHVNITTADTRGRGYFSAWASGPRPTASVLNTDGPGQVRANAVTVPLDPDRKFRVFTSAGDHVIVDVMGWHS